MEQNKQAWIWIAVVLVALLFAGSIGGYHMKGVGFGFGWVFMLLFWGLLIWLLFTQLNASHLAKRLEEKPLGILELRYAKGEISKKQYAQMRKELER